MGEELKSPFIDSISSFNRPKSIITSSKLRNNLQAYREIIPIKESLKKISEDFVNYLPHHKQIPHGTVDGLLFESHDTIIALCYEDYLLSYNLISGHTLETKFKTNLYSLSKGIDEDIFFALGADFFYIIDRRDFEILKKINFQNLKKCASFNSNEVLVTDYSQILILNLNNYNFKPTGIKDQHFTFVDYGKNHGLICVDGERVKKFSNKFELIAEIKIANTNFVKFSQNLLKIVAVTNSQLIILTEKLEIFKVIFTNNQVTDVYYEEKHEFLVTSDSNGLVSIYDLRIEKRKFDIKAHFYAISKIFYRDKKVYILGTECKISIVKVPKIHSLYVNRIKASDIAIVSDYSNLAYIENNNQVQLWNFKEDIKYSYFKHEGLASTLVSNQNKLYVNDLSSLFEINTSTLEFNKVDKSSELKYSSMVICEKYLICAGLSQVIQVWETNPLKEFTQLRGHEDYINCLSSFKNFLISGSLDCTVRIWSMKDMSLKQTLESHTKKITCTVADKGKVISASDDRTIKIWYIKTGDLIFTIENIIGSIRSLISFGGDFFISCGSTGKIIYWDMNTYTEVLSSKSVGTPLGLVGNEYVIAYFTRKNIQIMRNPLFYEKLSVFGPDESLKYSFYNYCYQFLNANTPEYEPRMDKWTILPYFLNPIHLYSYFNISEYITLAFQNGGTLIQSRLDQNPLSIAVSRDLESCVECILKPLKSQLSKNPFILGFINNKSLIEMNFSSHISLPLFYDLFFTEVSSDKLPKFIAYNLSLPIYVHSPNILPSSHRFFDEKHIKDAGQPLIFTRSIVKLNLELGSHESVALLQSIADCRNQEIFRSGFIQAYLNDKWNTVKWFMWAQFIIYFSYLSLLCIYIVHYYENQKFLAIPFIVSIFLTFYEAYKVYVSKISEYFYNYWNIIDLGRAFFFFLYSFNRFVAPPKKGPRSQVHETENIDNVLLILTFLSFLRGLSYFRLFESTRHFAHLIYQVILDSRSFTVMMLYSTVGLGFLLYIVFKFDDNYSIYLGNAFLVDIDYLDPTYFNQTQWTVYAFGITINYLMFCTVLYSIYCNTFYVILEIADISNYRTLALMALETERNMIWKRKESKTKYLQMCNKEIVEADSDPMMTKVKDIKSRVKDINGKIEEFLEIKKDIGKIIAVNSKISREIRSKFKVEKTDRGSQALLLVIMLVKYSKLENSPYKSDGVKKILKIINRIRH